MKRYDNQYVEHKSFYKQCIFDKHLIFNYDD